MTQKFPKTLIATSFPPGVPGGSPWVMEQLLRDAPREKISWWAANGDVPPHAAQLVSRFKSGEIPSRLQPQRRLVELKSIILEQIWVRMASRSFQKFVREQRPELIWILPYGWSIPVLHRVIPKLGIPWHMTLHDLADNSGLVDSLGLTRARRFQRMNEDLYTGSTSRDVYMQPIADEMQRLTGRPADAVIRCGAEPEEIEYVVKKEFLPPQGKIRIGYPGTIIAEQTFAKILAALKLLESRLPLPVEIHLFGNHSYRNRPWYDERVIVEHGYLPEDEMIRRYRSCDWGLVIMELDGSNPRYNQFTFPCKFTRALADGLPIISVAHPETTLIRMARKYQIGAVLTSPNEEALAEELLPWLSGATKLPGQRDEMLRCIKTEFDAEANRRILYALLNASARTA